MILPAVIAGGIIQTYIFLANWQSSVTRINAQSGFNGSITDAFRSEVLSKALIIPILHNSVPRIYGWIVYVIIIVSVAGVVLHAIVSGRNAIDVSLASLIVILLLGTAVGRNSVFLEILLEEISRHFFLPLCLLLVVVLRLATREKGSLKSKAILLVFLVVLTSYSAAYFRIQPYVDFGWKSYTAEFDPTGNWSLWVPINPPGWFMQISSNPAELMLELNQMTKMKGGLGLITIINGENGLTNRTVIDRCSGNPYLVFQGWAATSGTDTVRAVYLVLDNSYAFPTTYETSSITQSNPRLATWTGTVSANNLTTGSHELSMWILLTSNRVEIVDGVSYLQVTGSC
jgi:hypothetical protein